VAVAPNQAGTMVKEVPFNAAYFLQKEMENDEREKKKKKCL